MNPGCCGRVGHCATSMTRCHAESTRILSHSTSTPIGPAVAAVTWIDPSAIATDSSGTSARRSA